MSDSCRPWLAVRQPSFRGGVPQVTTRPGDVPGKCGAEEKHVIPTSERVLQSVLLVERRHVDLVRTGSAACRPGRACPV